VFLYVYVQTHNLPKFLEVTLFVPIKKFRVVMDVSHWRQQNFKPTGGKEKFYTADRSNIQLPLICHESNTDSKSVSSLTATHHFSFHMYPAHNSVTSDFGCCFVCQEVVCLHVAYPEHFPIIIIIIIIIIINKPEDRLRFSFYINPLKPSRFFTYRQV
jgi:hypothetical protein